MGGGEGTHEGTDEEPVVPPRAAVARELAVQPQGEEDAGEAQQDPDGHDELWRVVGVRERGVLLGRERDEHGHIFRVRPDDAREVDVRRRLPRDYRVVEHYGPVSRLLGSERVF